MTKWLLSVVLLAAAPRLLGQGVPDVFTGTVHYRVTLTEAEAAVFGEAYPDSLRLQLTERALRLDIYGGVGDGLYMLLDSAGRGWLVKPQDGLYTQLHTEKKLRVLERPPVKDSLPTVLGVVCTYAVATSDSGRWSFLHMRHPHLPAWIAAHPTAPVWLGRENRLPLRVVFDYYGVCQLPKRVTYEATQLGKYGEQELFLLPSGFREVGPAKFYVTGPY